MKFSINNLKNKFKAATLEYFDHNIKVFNTWFMDKRNAIVIEVEQPGYTNTKGACSRLIKLQRTKNP
eukprot:5455326-Ditylum_brightwellii.AAC.1